MCLAGSNRAAGGWTQVAGRVPFRSRCVSPFGSAIEFGAAPPRTPRGPSGRHDAGTHLAFNHGGFRPAGHKPQRRIECRAGSVTARLVVGVGGPRWARRLRRPVAPRWRGGAPGTHHQPAGRQALRPCLRLDHQAPCDKVRSPLEARVTSVHVRHELRGFNKRSNVVAQRHRVAGCAVLGHRMVRTGA